MPILLPWLDDALLIELRKLAQALLKGNSPSAMPARLASLRHPHRLDTFFESHSRELINELTENRFPGSHARVLGDTREHSRADFVAVVEGEQETLGQPYPERVAERTRWALDLLTNRLTVQRPRAGKQGVKPVAVC